MDVLRHLGAGNAQIRTMLGYFDINRRARVNVEMKVTHLFGSYLFLILIMFNEHFWNH